MLRLLSLLMTLLIATDTLVELHPNAEYGTAELENDAQVPAISLNARQLVTDRLFSIGHHGKPRQYWSRKGRSVPTF